MKKGAFGGEKRLLWADVVRVMSMWWVVMIHVSGGALDNWETLSRASWLVVLVYNAVARFGVPWFVMLSGALLLGREEGIGRVWSRRVPRLVLPWLVWGTVELVWFLKDYGQEVGSVWRFIYAWYMGNYWFMPLILGLYVLLPVLRVFVRHAESKDLGYLLGWWFVVIVVLPFWSRVSSLGRQVTLPLSIEFLGYFVFGYWVGRWRWGRKWLVWAGLVGGLGVLMTVLGTWRATWESGRFVVDYLDYLSLGVVLGAGGWFVVVREAEHVWERLLAKWRWWLEEVSGVCFGVFLVHQMLIRSGVFGLGGVAFGEWGWVGIPVVTTLVFMASVGLVWGLKQVPGLARFVT